MRNILFVCTANFDRSPTAEEMYKDDERYEIRSCGTSRYAKKNISQELVDWADQIFVMNEKEDNHKSIIIEKFDVNEEKIVDLDIPDIYRRGEPKLKELLRERLEPHLH